MDIFPPAYDVTTDATNSYTRRRFTHATCASSLNESVFISVHLWLTPLPHVSSVATYPQSPSNLRTSSPTVYLTNQPYNTWRTGGPLTENLRTSSLIHTRPLFRQPLKPGHSRSRAILGSFCICHLSFVIDPKFPVESCKLLASLGR